MRHDISHSQRQKEVYLLFLFKEGIARMLPRAYSPAVDSRNCDSV